ncbi:MAG: transposase [Candidatus Acidiferrales bacterium]
MRRKLAYGHRRVAWWLQRKEGLHVNRKRVLRVMRRFKESAPSSSGAVKGKRQFVCVFSIGPASITYGPLGRSGSYAEVASAVSMVFSGKTH